MPVTANNLLRARAVVGDEEDCGVVEGFHRFELLEDAADFDVHAVNHRGVQRHLERLKLLFLGA